MGGYRVYPKAVLGTDKMIRGRGSFHLGCAQGAGLLQCVTRIHIDFF